MNARSEDVEMPVARQGARRKTCDSVPVGTSSAFSKRNAADMGRSASAAAGS